MTRRTMELLSPLEESLPTAEQEERAWVYGWHCSEHGATPDCWTSSHITLQKIRDDVAGLQPDGTTNAGCAETCGCWRHRLLTYMEANPL